MTRMRKRIGGVAHVPEIEIEDLVAIDHGHVTVNDLDPVIVVTEDGHLRTGHVIMRGGVLEIAGGHVINLEIVKDLPVGLKM